MPFNSKLFEILVRERKTLIISPVILHKKGGNYFEGKVPATIEKQALLIDFIANKQRYIITKYLLQLRCPEFNEKPYFRLDSDGPAHRNKEIGSKTVLESISTPHFNTFNEKGKPIAYKSPLLSDGKKSKALQDDITLGIKHFCEEANVRLNTTAFPVLEYKVPEFDLNDSVIDPNSTVKFKV